MTAGLKKRKKNGEKKLLGEGVIKFQYLVWEFGFQIRFTSSRTCITKREVKSNLLFCNQEEPRREGGATVVLLGFKRLA